MSCLACDNNAAVELPSRERVARTAHWRVAHAFGTSIPGWLVVLPTVHVESLAELDPAAALELGTLLRELSRALEQVSGCVKTHAVLFAEAEGFAHLHVHLIPRMTDQPEQLRGPRVFAALGVPPDREVSAAEQDRIAADIAARLAGSARGAQTR